jgi:hypothetical protein
MNLTSFLVPVWEWLTHAWSVVIPSAAISAATIVAIFKWSGQKWVERILSRDLERFKGEQQTQLEGFKAEQQKELERLRHLLSTRVSKIHEKEFEVLPQAWLMLNRVRGAVTRAVDLTMKPHPNFKGFSDAKLDAFLNSDEVSWLSENQKYELRNANDKTNYYMDALKSNYIDVANEEHRVFLNYLIEHRIFMTEDLRAKFYAAQTALFSALTSYSVGTSAGNSELVLKGQEEMLNNMQGRVDDVERAIQARLHYEDAY